MKFRESDESTVINLNTVADITNMSMMAIIYLNIGYRFISYSILNKCAKGTGSHIVASKRISRRPANQGVIYIVYILAIIFNKILV